MPTRTSRMRITLLLALAPLAFLGCAEEAPTAAVRTVRLTVIPGANHGGRPFSTHMTQEVTTQPVWAGDPDGTGDALITLNLGQNEICWDLSVDRILLPATASHIHRAAPGVRGNIVIGLTAPGLTGAATGCKSDVDPELLKEILQDPANFYVNVHTSDFPAGAIRGQLP